MSTREKIREIIGDGTKTIHVDPMLYGSARRTQQEVSRIASKMGFSTRSRTTPRSLIVWFIPKGAKK